MGEQGTSSHKIIIIKKPVSIQYQEVSFFFFSLCPFFVPFFFFF